SDRLPYGFHRNCRAIVSSLLADRDRLLDRRQRNAINGELPTGDALVHAHRGGIDGHHEGRNAKVVVMSLVHLVNSLGLEPLCQPGVVVILCDVMDAGPASAPSCSEGLRHLFHSSLISPA